MYKKLQRFLKRSVKKTCRLSQIREPSLSVKAKGHIELWPFGDLNSLAGVFRSRNIKGCYSSSMTSVLCTSVLEVRNPTKLTLYQQKLFIVHQILECLFYIVILSYWCYNISEICKNDNWSVCKKIISTIKLNEREINSTLWHVERIIVC